MTVTRKLRWRGVKSQSRKADTRLMLTLSKALLGGYSCVTGTPHLLCGRGRQK